MNELIKREDAIKATWHEPSYIDPYNILTEVRDRIEALPTIDAVPVVRCKDCDMWDTERSVGKEYLGTYRCQCENWSDFEGGMMRYTTADDFCSYAERREE